VFNQNDIKSAFERFGYTVDYYEESEESRKIYSSRELEDAIRAYDVVFSVNYFSRVSDMCQKTGRKYIAWTVDSPMIAMYHMSVFNECNYIFIFDQFCYRQFKSMGVKNVFYLPLAVDVNRLDHELSNLTLEDELRFKSEISFVGGLYYKNSYDDIKSQLPEYLQGYFDAAMQAQLDLFGENIFDRLLTVDILAELSQHVEFIQEERSLSDLKLVFTSTFLGFKMAQIERVTCLNRLAKHSSLDLYTDKPSPDLENVNLKGSVSYEIDMPKVFRLSKVNMNFTIRNIRSGIPLRIWDVLGAKGFLLTNFQAELPAYFENGKDLVYYESLDDMEKKAEYYLNHEEERMQIAIHGHDKVKAYHSYDVRIKEIIQKSGLK
jgi:spore maturation protein CgeB